MRLHWLQPDDERRDCEFCREHEHYSFTNPDRSKAGKPIVEQGRVRRRGRGDVPQCHLCPAIFAWSEANRALYVRWRFWIMGVRPAPLDARTAWAFFRLEEAAREIAGEAQSLSFNRAIVEAFNG